jgi:hypothetical protein
VETADGPTVVPIEPATPEATFREADQLLQYVRQLRDGVMKEPSLTVVERLKLCGQVAEIVGQLGKLTGVALSNERQIVSSPPFANVTATITRALEPWPDAMRAVGEALLRLEAVQ